MSGQSLVEVQVAIPLKEFYIDKLFNEIVLYELYKIYN